MRKALAIGLFMLFAGAAYGNHIIGGYLYYECLGNHVYKITLELYRDCNSNGADFDSPAHIGVFDDSHQLVQYLEAPYPNVVPLQIETGNPCLSAPPNICVQKGTTTVTVTLDNSNTGYYIVYQRCCRNATILNLVDPGSQGATYLTYIPPASDVVCNNSPQFTSYPPLVLCANSPFSFDDSAIDPDGDSLVYSLCTPYQGATATNPAPYPGPPPYTNVLWSSGFSSSYPMQGSPGLTIDPQTGVLSGTPTQLGQYVVGVSVKEYRNGQLIGDNRRDFQFNVTNCVQAVNAAIAPQSPLDFCSGLTVDFQNQSTGASSFFWNFGVPNIDSDTSNIIAPSYTYPDSGTYQVMLVGNPGFSCADTAYQDIIVHHSYVPSYVLPHFVCNNGQPTYNFKANTSGVPSTAVYTWTFDQGSPGTVTDSIANGITFPNPGTYTAQLSITVGECQQSSSLDVQVADPTTVHIHPQTNFCIGLNQPFAADYTGAQFFHWDFGVPSMTNDTSNLSGSNFTYPTQGTYLVSLTAWSSVTCPVTDQQSFEVHPLLNAAFDQVPTLCQDNGPINFSAGGAFTNDATFNWNFNGGQPAYSTAQNPHNVLFDSLGTFPVQLVISQYGCADTVVHNVRVEPEPRAEFIPLKKDGCVPLTVNFENQSITQAISHGYSWNYGDGETGAGKIGRHTYTSPGTYTVSLTLQNFDGCMGTSVKTKTGLIEVYPKPIAGFRLEPSVMSIFDPTVQVLNQSPSPFTIGYYFNNDSIIGQENTTINFHDPQPVDITQRVSNEYGCRASFTQHLGVKDHSIYVPNAFTPDGDGTNDLFKPVVLGVTQLDMYIYNRWGSLVWYSHQLGEGWNGCEKGSPYLEPDGLYTYIIVVTDLQGISTRYEGAVHLLR